MWAPAVGTTIIGTGCSTLNSCPSRDGWNDEAIFSLLREHNVGFCVFDMPDYTSPVVATADFAYFRFHGNAGLYQSCYGENELAGWARKITSLTKNLKVVYVYFNNDAQAFAVKNARTMGRLLDSDAGTQNIS